MVNSLLSNWNLACFCIIILTFNSSFAQDYDYTQYTMEDGLPTNYVYGVVEDDNGVIWAYTENGLAKFDGYTFKHYSTKNGLPGNDIVNTIKDDDGKVFFAIHNNKPAYLYQDSIYVIHDKPCDMLQTLIDGIAHYNCGGNLLKFDALSNRLIKVDSLFIDSSFLKNTGDLFALEKKMSNKSRIFILKDNSTRSYVFNKEIVWLPNTHNAVIYNYEDKTFHIFKNKTVRSLTHNEDFSIEQPSFFNLIFQLSKIDKYVLIGKRGELLLLDLNEESITKLKLKGLQPNQHILPTLLDSTFLLNTDAGYLEYDFKGRLLEKYNPKELTDNYFCLRGYKDSKGNFWIGTREGGLFLIPREKSKTTLLTSKITKDKPYERLIRTYNNQLLGFTDNLGIYHIKGDEVINIFTPAKKERFRSANATAEGVFVSTNRRGLQINYNEDSWKINSVKLYPSINQIENNSIDDPSNIIPAQTELKNVISMTYDNFHQLLYAIFHDNTITHYKFSNNQKIEWETTNLKGNVLHFHSDKNKLYIADTEGVYYLNKGRRIPFLKEKAIKNVSSLFGTGDELWIGTESNGLFYYSYVTREISKISDANMIRRLKPNNKGDVLAATNDGIFIFSRDNSTFKQTSNYTTKDGLLINEIQDIHPSEDCKFLYVATSSGLHKIDLQKSKENRLVSKNLSITDLRINSTHFNKNDLWSFSHKENNLDIHFHLQSYESSGNIEYFTKLAPIQSEWHRTKERRVFYPELNPNEYQFHLKAKDAYGNQVSLNPKDFTIKKAVHQTLVFKIIITLSSLGILILALIQREKQQKQKLEKEKNINNKIAELELSALRAQMNPHFVFNALGSIQYYIQINDIQLADEYLTKFANLMRLYLDSSKEKLISLKDEVKLLRIYSELEQMRFEDLFTVQFNIESGLYLEDIFIPPMLIQPFIENAINHGLEERKDKQGVVEINFYKDNDSLICLIKDNGIGRSKASKLRQRKTHKSRGTDLLNEKIETLKTTGLADVNITIQDLYPDATEYPGTLVTLQIKNYEDENT